MNSVCVSITCHAASGEFPGHARGRKGHGQRTSQRDDVTEQTPREGLGAGAPVTLWNRWASLSRATMAGGGRCNEVNRSPAACPPAHLPARAAPESEPEGQPLELKPLP